MLLTGTRDHQIAQLGFVPSRMEARLSRDATTANAFLLILWSGGISYVRPFFPPQARKDRVPGCRFWRNGRVEFSFLVYTISKNAINVRF